MSRESISFRFICVCCFSLIYRELISIKKAMQEEEEEETEINNCKLYLFFSVSVQDLFQDKKFFFLF